MEPWSTPGAPWQSGAAWAPSCVDVPPASTPTMRTEASPTNG